MKTPRLSVVVAAMKAEYRILSECSTMTTEEVVVRLAVLRECIARLEPNGTAADTATVTKPRTRKPKAAAETERTL